ncbi:MAG: MEDS domain-containing protein [bacterium]
MEHGQSEGYARAVDFGFTEAVVPSGTHVCHIYDDNEERTDAFVRFLLKGLELRELSAGFSDALCESDFSAHLADGQSLRRLRLKPTAETYFPDNRFDPDGMLRSLAALYDRSRDEGFTGTRVIGEMAPEIETMEGADRLLEYESRVNLLLGDRAMTVMCRYDTSAFSGAKLMDVLKSHPLMVVRGSIIHNPFYLSPEIVLGEHKTGRPY